MVDNSINFLMSLLSTEQKLTHSCSENQISTAGSQIIQKIPAVSNVHKGISEH